MRLLYFYRKNVYPNSKLSMSFTNTVTFEIRSIKSGIELIVETKESSLGFAERLFINDQNDNVIKYVNAIVGENGVGKTTCLEEIAGFSLPKDSQSTTLHEFYLEIVEINNSIVISWHYINNEDKNHDFTVSISSESRRILEKEFRISEIKLNRIRKTNFESPTHPNFSVIMFSNDERARGEWGSSHAKNGFYNAKEYEKFDDDYYIEHAFQITSSSIEHMGNEYFKELCPQKIALLGRESLFNNLMKRQYETLTRRNNIYGLLYLDFMRALESKRLTKGVFAYLFKRNIHFSFTPIDRVFGFIWPYKHNIEKFVRETTDWGKDDRERPIIFPEKMQLQDAIEQWILENRNLILERGAGYLFEKCGKSFNTQSYDEINDIYFYFVHEQLVNKFINFNKGMQNYNGIFTLKINLLFEMCSAFLCTNDVLNCGSIDDALSLTLKLVQEYTSDEAIWREYKNAEDNEVNLPEEYRKYGPYKYRKKLLNYFNEAFRDLIKLQNFIEQQKYSDFELRKYLSEAIAKKSFYIKYLQIKGLGFSSGEKRLLNIFSTLNAKFDATFEKQIILEKNILLLIDDLERDCHPAWQLKILSEVLNGFNMLYPNKLIHLIFSTHSPLLLSDIPKECVIALERKAEEIDGSINIGRVDLIDQTFGANVYDLYQNAFFLRDGYIGEYAKGRIDTAIKIIKNNYFLKLKNVDAELNINEIKKAIKIVELIGEQILKSKLENMLTEMIGDKK